MWIRSGSDFSHESRKLRRLPLGLRNLECNWQAPQSTASIKKLPRFGKRFDEYYWHDGWLVQRPLCQPWKEKKCVISRTCSNKTPCARFRFVTDFMTSHVAGFLTADKSFQAHPVFSDRKDRWAVAILICGVALMFWKVLFASRMLFYRDILNQSYPTARLIHEICRRGFLPYWNPYLNFGQPILENPNSLFFYPSTLLVVLLSVDLGYTLHFVLHFMLAAVGTYCLARRWQQSYVAAFFAACFFVFSGPVLS